MRTFAIGDLHGCLEPLLTLLDTINFDDSQDRLWFVGDLVNRGPQTLETLRFVKSLGASAVTVLGNHDFHLLAVLKELRTSSAKDTLQDIIDAPDRAELELWLRQQPLLHHDPTLNYTMVHAGMHTSWDLTTAMSLADQISVKLQSSEYHDFLEQIFSRKSVNWHSDLAGTDLLCFAVNCFTRMRYLIDSNRLDFQCSLPPASAPATLTPWFDVSNRQNLDVNIIFGHWASLGDHRIEGVFPLDSGCVWGNALSAMQLETREVFSVRC